MNRRTFVKSMSILAASTVVPTTFVGQAPDWNMHPLQRTFVAQLKEPTTLEAIIPKMLAQGLEMLRAEPIMPRLVATTADPGEPIMMDLKGGE